jgi:hypothetical protein
MHGSFASDFASSGTDARFLCKRSRFIRNRCTVPLQPITVRLEPMHGSFATDRGSSGTDHPSFAGDFRLAGKRCIADLDLVPHRAKVWGYKFLAVFSSNRHPVPVIL